MKKLIFILVTILAAVNLSAEKRVVERTYLSTDKACYVAGDNVWISAFCLDVADNNRFSEFSSLAYVELCSADGVEATAKVALIHGRGAGALVLPRALPTGNYKLIAYTAQNRNEVGYDFFETSKTISVFNTFTSERKGVKVVSADSYGTPDVAEGNGDVAISLDSRKGRVAKLTLDSKLAKASSLSVSVYHEDAIVSPENDGISQFVDRAKHTATPAFEQNVIPDFEGEVVVAHVVGSNAADHRGDYAIISSPGDLSGVYYASIEDDCSAVFCTNNYYGDNVLVCQIESNGEVKDAHVELDSPFVQNKASDIQTLSISESLNESLAARGTAMQIEKLFVSDTLYERLPQRPNLLLAAQKPNTYILKDYTRFPLMSEVVVEFVKGLSFKKEDKKPYVHITLMDSSKPVYQSNKGSLALIDGTPILDHQKIYDYDPLLVERIDIYPSTFFIGPRCCNGLVNFVTYKRDMTNVTFPDDVRVVDYQGACFPLAYTCSKVSENSNFPDYRNTLYWHPIVDLGAGEKLSFECQLPNYDGSFRVVVEGISEDGKPICETFKF